MINLHELELAIQLLKRGEIIALPTETVYALAGDARNISALKQIFKLKNRPLNQPLSVLLARNHPLEMWADDITPLVRKLTQHFWPGPLTLILNKNKSVLPQLTGGQAKIGLRVPDHPIAQAILQAFTGGLAAPSANRSAHLSPTLAQHVRQEFGTEIQLIIDGGPCSSGIESTIIDMTVSIPQILRLGAISVEQIQQVIDLPLIYTPPVSSVSPEKKLLEQIITKNLKSVISEYLSQGKTITVLALSSPSIYHEKLIWISMPNDVGEYGRVLYQHLHEAEQRADDKILVESLPKVSVWAGIQSTLDKNSLYLRA